jgi:uncharacterized integral membrane protein (TIGR00698 family)
MTAIAARLTGTDDGAAGRLLPGLALAGAVAVVATAAGRAVPVVGGPVIGIVIGVALRGRLGRRARLDGGPAFAAGPVLEVAVVTLGAQLSLREVAAVGASSLPVMLGTLGTCLLLAALLGRRLGIERDLRTLIGVGTAVCGASAIAAVSPVMRAKGQDVAYAVSTIFLFNVAAVLTFPLLGHLSGLDQHAFGLFAGTAVNDTSSVVAAAARSTETARRCGCRHAWRRAAQDRCRPRSHVPSSRRLATVCPCRSNSRR